MAKLHSIGQNAYLFRTFSWAPKTSYSSFSTLWTILQNPLERNQKHRFPESVVLNLNLRISPSLSPGPEFKKRKKSHCSSQHSIIASQPYKKVHSPGLQSQFRGIKAPSHRSERRIAVLEGSSWLHAGCFAHVN